MKQAIDFEDTLYILKYFSLIARHILYDACLIFYYAILQLYHVPHSFYITNCTCIKVHCVENKQSSGASGWRMLEKFLILYPCNFPLCSDDKHGSPSYTRIESSSSRSFLYLDFREDHAFFFQREQKSQLNDSFSRATVCIGWEEYVLSKIEISFQLLYADNFLKGSRLNLFS